MKKFPKILTAAAILLLVATSCARYHFGNNLPQTQRDIAVTEIQNLTSETALTPLLQDAMRECVMNTPGVKLTTPTDATLELTAKITSLDQSKGASAKTRNKLASHDDGDSYQTVLYRLTMKCQYTAAPTREDAIPRTGEIEATADVPLMQDLALAQQAALKQLARDAANQIVNALCEE